MALKLYKRGTGKVPTTSDKVKIANQIVRSAHGLTAVQFKLFLAIIHHLQTKTDRLESDFVVKIPIAELQSRGVIKDKNIYNLVADEAAGMGNLSLLVEVPKQKALRRIFFFTAMEAREGILKISLSGTGMPYLDGLKEYYSLHSLPILMKLRSNYSIRMYMILYQFKDTGWANLTVDKLKEKFNIEDEYPNFSHFRKYVLEKAQKEIHENTDLRFQWSEFKQGRRIHTLYFEIFEENEAPKTLNTSKKSKQKDLFPDQDVWRDRLKNLYQLTDSQISEIFELVDSENYKDFTKTFHQMELKRTNKEVNRLPGFAVSMLTRNLKK